MTSAPVTALAACGNDLSTHKFVTEVGATNLLEIKIGKLALQKSHSHVVRVFAHWMIFEHSPANNVKKHGAITGSIELCASQR